MTYSPLLIVHIVAGMMGVATGFAAVIVRKGSPLHRRAGDVFVVSMMAMAASGGALALVKGQRMNVLAGVFTFYLVWTAWLTVRRRSGETGLSERILLLIALAAASSALMFAWQAAHRATAQKGATVFYVVFATITLLSASGDGLMILRGGVSGAKRLVRHLWRMNFALFIATASFFLGTAGDPVMRRSGLRATLFSPAVRATHLPQLPVLLVVILTIYWLFRVKGTRSDRNAKVERRSGSFIEGQNVQPQEVVR